MLGFSTRIKPITHGVNILVNFNEREHLLEVDCDEIWVWCINFLFLYPTRGLTKIVQVGIITKNEDFFMDKVVSLKKLSFSLIHFFEKEFSFSAILHKMGTDIK